MQLRRIRDHHEIPFRPLKLQAAAPTSRNPPGTEDPAIVTVAAHITQNTTRSGREIPDGHSVLPEIRGRGNRRPGHQYQAQRPGQSLLHLFPSGFSALQQVGGFSLHDAASAFNPLSRSPSRTLRRCLINGSARGPAVRSTTAVVASDRETRVQQRATVSGRRGCVGFGTRCTTRLSGSRQRVASTRMILVTSSNS